MKAPPRRTRTRPAVPLYPDGHAPFRHRGCRLDDTILRTLPQTAELSRLECVESASLNAGLTRWQLEQMRVLLYRAEALAAQDPTFSDRQSSVQYSIRYEDLPDQVVALLETLDVTKQCLEEWLESETCKTLISRTPGRQRPP